MKPVVDQFRDPTLAILVHLVADRPKVAAAIADTEIEPEDLNTLPNSAFAWQEKRAFPVHSRDHAILSRVYRENMQGVPAYVDQALKEACDVYGIDETMFVREKRAAAVEDPEDFLLPDMKRLKVTDAASVKTAEATLLRDYQKLSVENRALACSRLLNKAAAFGATLHPLMHKLAGFTVTSTDTMRRWLEARSEAAPEGYKEAFQKLADATKKLPAEIRDRATQVKLAGVIAELDKKAGLVKHYDRKLPDAMQTIFNTTKIAGEGVELNGKFFSMNRLASYPASFYADILGGDITREAADAQGNMDPYKLSCVLETLPRDMKSLLASNMR